MNISSLTDHAGAATKFLKSLANEHRLLILCHLIDRERSVGELEKLLGMRQPALSQQLAKLREEGLVATRRQSRTIYYRLASTEAKRMVALLYDMFCPDEVKENLGASGDVEQGKPATDET